MKDNITDFVDYLNRFRDKNGHVNNKPSAMKLLTTYKYMLDYCPEYANALEDCTLEGVSCPERSTANYNLTMTNSEGKNVVLIKKGDTDKSVFSHTYIWNISDLGCFGDGEFDVVVNLSGFCDLFDPSKHDLCAKECLRVLKGGGTLFMAYHNKFNSFFKFNRQWQAGFRIFDGSNANGVPDETAPICYVTPDGLESTMSKLGVAMLKNVATDTFRFITQDTISSIDDDTFERYLKLHFEMCESNCLLDYSEHALYIGRKSVV